MNMHRAVFSASNPTITTEQKTGLFLCLSVRWGGDRSESFRLITQQFTHFDPHLVGAPLALALALVLCPGALLVMVLMLVLML